MARMDKIGKTATKIRVEGKTTFVRYHATDVVAFDEDTVTLNSGGWSTRTTMARMNQTANQYGLPFQVFQRKYRWFVTIGTETVDFRDGMTFARRQVYASKGGSNG